MSFDSVPGFTALKKWLPVWLSLAILAGAVSLRISKPDVMVTLQHAVFDAYQRWKPRVYKPAPVRIIDIDDASLARLGQWPWPRREMADLVSRLTAMGAAAIVFDVTFPEPDRTSPQRVLADIGNVPGLADVLKRLPDHDQVFADAIRASRVVTGFNGMGGASRAALPPAKFGVAHAGPDPLPFLLSFKSAVTSLPVIDSAAAGIGAMNFAPDTDGVVRRVPVVVNLAGKVYPSLDMEALRVAQGASTYIVKSVGASSERGFGEETGVTAVKVGALSLPTGADGTLWLHYTAHRADRFIPAWRVLQGKLDAARVRNAIVLVGTSAVGLQDLRYSPMGADMPGVEIHAQILEQILQGDFIQRPDWMTGAEILFTVALSLAMIVLVYRFGALASALVGMTVVAGALGLSLYAYAAQGRLVDPVVPSGTASVVFLVVSVLRHIQAEKERRWIHNAFRSYVSPNLVDELVANPGQLRLGGERKDLSFIFTDLAGFTTLVEQAQPGELIPMLNDYLAGMIGIGLDHGGTLDAIIGDATTFFFNAPLDQPDHAQRAFDCALALDEFAQAFSLRKNAEGFPLGKTRIGVHSGSVIIGNMGGEILFNYCAHGDAINTAARLESINKHLGTRVCISGETVGRCTGFTGRPVGDLVLKGKSEPIAAFEPLPASEVHSERVTRYVAAFAQMKAEDPRAQDSFAALLADYPEDSLAAFHLKRLESGSSGIRVVMGEK